MVGSATVAERGTDAVGDVEGGSPVEVEGLPELRFVHPMPGFPRLQRFVLVRLDDEAAGEPVSEVGPGDDGRSAGGAAGEGPPLSDAPGNGSSSAGAAADAMADHLSGANSSGTDSLLFELRSLEQPEVRFLVGPPAAFFTDYTLELDEQSCADLELADAADALVLVILSVGSEAALTTANLLAPVVINSRTRTAAQIILTGTDWPVRAPIGLAAGGASTHSTSAATILWPAR